MIMKLQKRPGPMGAVEPVKKNEGGEKYMRNFSRKT
jgi:hypothetical protein